MSHPYAMQKPLIISAGAVSALLGVSVLIASSDEPLVSSTVPPVLGSSGRPTVLLAANDWLVASHRPSPGVYEATPYTMLAVIPTPVDQSRAVGVGDISRFNMPLIKPETKLEPLMLPDNAAQPAPRGAVVGNSPLSPAAAKLRP